MITMNKKNRLLGYEPYDVEYKGLSTDTKPTDCGANSLFLELDTGKFFYFDGTAWSEVGGQ